MRDYVIKINDVNPWRTALRAEALAGSPYASIDTNDEVKLNLATTGIIGRLGQSTVSICRLTQEQYDWLLSLPQVTELGRGEVINTETEGPATLETFIKDLSDITWIGAGKGLYHAIHLQEPYEVTDGEGGTILITPPLLHCTLAS
jgi:hypothetical protein